MNTVVWSDLHIDHFSAAKARGFETLKDFQDVVIDGWEKKVTSRTTIILVGDVALYRPGLSLIKKLPGKKILVPGNHDLERDNDMRDVLEVYDRVEGLWKHKRGIWFSHAPMHPSQLRGRRQIHGHSHTEIIQDERYINVCWDLLKEGPVDFEMILSGEYRSYRRPSVVDHAHVGEVNEQTEAVR
jgi:calcineurin-like phosphoesterase family protein